MMLKPLVYIVDDEPAVRQALCVTASLLDVEVSGFGSAREFLEAYQDGREACLVVDLRMPETTGLQLLEILHQRGDGLPVIVISGGARVAEAVQAMKIGAIDFLEKPYSIAALRHSILKALGIQRTKCEEARTLDAARSQFQSLSPEELRVVDGTLSGDTDKRIAACLDVSVRTVQLRRASAMTKLQARTKAGLIRRVHAMRESANLTG